jgi:predicted GH43/DUF377 family glycosyl hydrolase
MFAVTLPPLLAKKLRDDSEGEAPFEEMESRFASCMELPMEEALRIEHADIVVGIPFYNEAKTLPHVVQTAVEGLEQFFPEATSVVIAAGSPAGREALDAVQLLPRGRKVGQISFLLEDGLLEGKGWGIRAILMLADKLGADVALMEADLTTHTKGGHTHGLTPEWVGMLLEPIRSSDFDMVLSSFDLPPFDSPLCGQLAHPLLAAIYDCPIRCLLGGQWGIARHLLPTYLTNPHHAWETESSGYGVDSWLATAAIVQGAKICEAHLGTKRHRRLGGKSDIVFRQLSTALFDHVVRDSEWWRRSRATAGSPASIRLPVLGLAQTSTWGSLEIEPEVLVRKYQEGFDAFYSLYERVFREDTCLELERQAQIKATAFEFPPRLWTEVIYDLLLAYAFDSSLSRGDLVDALVPLHDGFSATRAADLMRLSGRLKALPQGERDRLLSVVAQSQEEELVDEFRRQLPRFVSDWTQKAEALRPPVPPVTYREFIPGVPLIVPTEMTGVEGNVVTANALYTSIFDRHKEDFERFVYERLGVPRRAGSLNITLAIKDFLRQVEDTLLPGTNMMTLEGAEVAVEVVIENFPHEEGFGLTSEMAQRLLEEHPPMTLLTRMGHTNLADLLEERDPRDMLALAPWAEPPEYMDAVFDLLLEELVPEHFEATPIRPVVVRHEDFPSLVELTSSTALDKLTCRIVVSNLHKGMGGEYPGLRYLTTIAKDIVEAERFGSIWKRFASDRKEFGRRVINSIEGHWGRDPLSAHSIFEDGNQRVLVERIRQLADNIESLADEGEAFKVIADNLRAVADSYHLALVLPDGKFVTCSAWSWAHYSFKGGRASPPPLSTRVERDWASREFLMEYYKALGGEEKDVEDKVVELMGEGRESDDLAEILLGTHTEAERLVPSAQGATAPEQPKAGPMERFAGNPILLPVGQHPWESKYVLNPGAIKLDGTVYLIYRACGEDGVSRLGLAISEDGFSVTERLSQPIFEPRGRADRKGCEDARLTLIGDRLCMAYTAYDGRVAQIALASLGLEDFVKRRWSKWRSHGFIFPRFTDKDAALFPVQFDGKYAMLHRVDPHIWITFSSHLRGPWSRKEHMILAGSTSGMMWDGHKIGAGAQPIKTEYGWLLITHGVDYARVYRLGVMLLDLADPAELRYRSPNFVLSPESEWELGKGPESWVSNVVFSCGAVPLRDDKDVLDAEDELIVYYGAADTVICAATVTVGALIPEELR